MTMNFKENNHHDTWGFSISHLDAVDQKKFVEQLSNRPNLVRLLFGTSNGKGLPSTKGLVLFFKPQVYEKVVELLGTKEVHAVYNWNDWEALIRNSIEYDTHEVRYVRIPLRSPFAPVTLCCAESDEGSLN